MDYIASPPKQEHEGLTYIEIVDDKVVTSYQYGKNSDFMAIVKDMGFTWLYDARFMGYRWIYHWAMPAGQVNGSVENIVAELGHRLLAAGFSIKCDSQELLDIAIRGEYTPRWQHWIIPSGDGYGILLSRKDGLYEKAMSLYGAKYNGKRYGRPCVIIPAQSVDELLDFADSHDYRYTDKAKAKLGDKLVSLKTKQGILEDLLDED